jgi:hypothetical protein
MPSIGPVTLKIVEASGQTGITITYTIRGTPDDIAQNVVYDERVELIGVDQGAGEDGHDELIASAFPVTQMQFGPTTSRSRSHSAALPAALFDEDPSLNITPDEIQARVTLTRHLIATSAQRSNVVVLHPIPQHS